MFQFSLKAPLTSKMSSKQHLLLGLLSLFLRPLEALPAFNATSNKIEVEEYGTKQTVKCFDQFNGYGNSLTVKYPVSDLWTYNWDNKISSCCFTGFWLMYEYRDYNQFNSNVSFKNITFHYVFGILYREWCITDTALTIAET